MTMNRRFFLKSGGVALASIGAATLAPSFLQRAALAQTNKITGGMATGRRKTLIAIFQRGAVDGLNVVVPHGERSYYSFRPTLAIPQPGKGAAGEAVIDLDGFFGLHPALAPFKPIWDAKRLAIVHAAGSPDNTRSHFDAQDYMESGTPGLKATGDGWLNRLLQAQGGARGQLAQRLTEFGQGIAALYQDLGPRMDDVVVLTMSEFGRTVRENGNRGTDHGHANAMFVIGAGVRGGKVYGDWPGLDSNDLYERRDLALTTDFRDVFGEVAAKHLGAADLKRVFPNHAASPAKFRGVI